MAMHVESSVGSAEPEVMMDINTTPLIDVMLVLLIMLIITIPAQLDALNLDMPVPSKVQKPVKPVVIDVYVDSTSQISWNGERLLSRQQLENKLMEAAAIQPQPELHIRSEGKAKYEAVAAVLATAQRNGLTKLGIVGTEKFSN